LDTIRSSQVQAVSAELERIFSAPFQASLDFLNRNELDMPASVRARITLLREAMTTVDVDSLTDPAAVEARVSAVRDAVAEVRGEIRRLIT